MATRTKQQESVSWMGSAWPGVIAVLRRRPVWAMALGISLLIGGKAAWHRYTPELTAHRNLLLDHDNLYATPQPSWIKSNVVDQAVKIGDLQGLSLLDRTTLERVRDAFAVQSWVAEVVEVRKGPTGIHVSLDYRRPVAMVEIRHQEEPKFQPVDSQGVLVPGNEFAKLETWDYLKIAVPDPATHGLIDGAPWPDPRVLEATAIADAWGDRWREVGVYRIQLVPRLDAATMVEDSSTFELHLINAERTLCRRVLWGHAPGREVVGEASAESKIASLIDAARTRPDWLPAGKHFALEGFDFDVRSGKVVVRPATGSTR